MRSNQGVQRPSPLTPKAVGTGGEVMRLLAIFVSFLLLTAIQIASAAEDWQTTAYDKAQTLFIAFDRKEAEILKRDLPRMVEFYAVFTPYQDAERKMRRYEFLNQIENDPKSIDWTNSWSWATGMNFGTKEQEQLAETDPVYRALREDFMAIKEILKRAKDLTRMRNTEYEKHSAELAHVESDLIQELKVLQAEVNRELGAGER